MAVTPTQKEDEMHEGHDMHSEDSMEMELQRIKDMQKKSLEEMGRKKNPSKGDREMSDAELIALMNQNNCCKEDNFMNNPFFYLIFIWLFAGFGGGGFGGFGGANAATTALTNDFLYESGQFQGLGQAIQAGFAASAECCCSTNRNVDSVRYDLGKDICQLGYANQQGFMNMQREIADCCCATNRNIDALSNQLTMSTCAIQQAIAEDGRLTRDFLVGNKIESLRDDLQTAQLALANAAQTQTIVNQVLSHIPCLVDKTA